MEAAGTDAITVVMRFEGVPNYFSKPCFFHNLDTGTSTDRTQEVVWFVKKIESLDEHKSPVAE